MATRNCAALACPRISNMDLPYVVSSHELSQDAAGHSWCNFCERQRLLMDWASEHRWPAVRVQGKMRYAIYGGDGSDWFASVAGGNQDMVDALYETLIENKRSHLPPLEQV